MVGELWGWDMRCTDNGSQIRSVLATLSRAISKEKNTRWYEITEKIEQVTKNIMLKIEKNVNISEC